MYKTLGLLVALLLPAAGLAAPHSITLSRNGAMILFHGTPGKRLVSNWNPPHRKPVIFSTMGPHNAYDCCSGWGIRNPGGSSWRAFPITPTADATVTEIVEAIGYIDGTNSVTIALMSDNGGLPGKVLQEKTIKNLDTFGNCCNVAVDKLKTPVQVTAGTTYWVAALLPKQQQASTDDAWNFSTENQNSVPAAFYYAGSWIHVTSQYSAFAVYGN